MPFIIDPVTEALIAPLIQRGREQYQAYSQRLDPKDRRIGGGSMNIIRRDDFIANIDLVLDHCTVNGVTIYLLAKDGRLCCLLSRFPDDYG